MRKGDATRQEILSIADRLFCTKGYDNTSVQDILDILHGSKGGFYHHFPSKGAVLETLCREKAEKAHTEAEEAMSVQTDTMQRLNTLFRYVNPLRMENMAFMDMLLPLLDRPEGMSVRVVSHVNRYVRKGRFITRKIKGSYILRLMLHCA